MTLSAARWRLATVWFVGCGLFAAILVAQTIGGAYGEEVERAWGWALPNFLPTLALMTSVQAAGALRPPAEATVGLGFFRLTLALSVAYILLLFVAVLAQPLFGGGGGDGWDMAARRFALMEDASLFLAPVQGLVVLALGALFFGAKEEGAA